METKRLFTKRKLLIALFAAIFMIALIAALSPRLAVQVFADTDTSKTAENASLAADIDMLFIDVEMDDGTLGWCPITYGQGNSGKNLTKINYHETNGDKQMGTADCGKTQAR